MEVKQLDKSTAEVADAVYAGVSFRLDHKLYALPLEAVMQIIAMVTITPLPQMDGAVEGLINVRGATVPVINLRRHLGLPPQPFELHTPIVLAQVHGRTVGLIVDEVVDVLTLSVAQISHLQDVLPPGLAESPLLRGVVYTDRGAVLLLNLEQLFTARQSQALLPVLKAMAQPEITPTVETMA